MRNLMFIACLIAGLLGCESQNDDCDNCTDVPTDGRPGDPGTDGTDGATSLIDTAPATDDQCPNGGGTVIMTGVDDNGNGTLDASEVDDIVVLCNGEDGEDGAPGHDGEDAETPDDGSDGEDGADAAFRERDATLQECPFGGTVLLYGTDDDGDSYLDTSEVDGDIITCNGAPGEDGQDGDPADPVDPPAPATAEVCDGIDNDDDGFADESISDFGPDGWVLTMSHPLPGSPGYDAQLIGWAGGSINWWDPDTVQGMGIAAQPGSWQTPTWNGQVWSAVAFDRWQIGSAFMSTPFEQRLDCEAVSQGVALGGTLTIHLTTPGEVELGQSARSCRTVTVRYIDYQGVPITPPCSL